MTKFTGYVIACVVLSLWSVCHGDRAAKPDGYGQDWELKLSLNSGFELGGRVHRSSYPRGFVFGSAGSAYQVRFLLFEDFLFVD